MGVLMDGSRGVCWDDWVVGGWWMGECDGHEGGVCGMMMPFGWSWV